jgi:hypothetical protein
MTDNDGSVVWVNRHKWWVVPHWIWSLVFSFTLSGGISGLAFELARLRSQKEAVGRQAVEDETERGEAVVGVR